MCILKIEYEIKIVKNSPKIVVSKHALKNNNILIQNAIKHIV